MRMTEISIEPFAHAHLDGLIALLGAEGWTEYTDDVERTRRALTAPGVTTLVAIADGHLVGAIQVQSDGLIQAPCFDASDRPELSWSRPRIQAVARRSRACGRLAVGRPHSDRGLLRAAWREPLARLSPHARGSRARWRGRHIDRLHPLRLGSRGFYFARQASRPTKPRSLSRTARARSARRRLAIRRRGNRPLGDGSNDERCHVPAAVGVGGAF